MTKSITELTSMVTALETKYDGVQLRLVDPKRAAFTEIRDVLNEMDDFIKEYMLYISLEKSTHSPSPYRTDLIAINDLKERLKTLSKSINLEEAQIDKLAKQIPEKGKEAAYRAKIGRATALKKNDNRTYIQQKYMGVAKAGSIAGRQIDFLATSGIASCVGYILFSRDKKMCVLAHVDDVFGNGESITGSDGRIITKTMYYDQLTKQALTLLGNPDPSSVEAILMTSQMPLSNELADELQAGLVANSISHVETRRTEAGEVSFKLGVEDYECEYYNELVPFDTLPDNKFTLRTVFGFPAEGMELYRMTPDGLVLQNLDEYYEYDSDLGGAIPRAVHQDHVSELDASLVETDQPADAKSPHHYTALASKEEEEKPTLEDDSGVIRPGFDLSERLASAKEDVLTTTSAEQKQRAMVASDRSEQKEKSATVSNESSQTGVDRGRSIRRRLVAFLTSCRCGNNNSVDTNATSAPKTTPSINGK